MKLSRVNFAGDIPLLGSWRKYLEASSNYDISSDGNWCWIEWLTGSNAGAIVGVPREKIFSVVPADPAEVRLRRDGPTPATAAKGKAA